MAEKKNLDDKPSKSQADDGDDELNRLLRAGNLDAMIPTDLSGKDKIEHANDAMDFESEDELADDEEVEESAADNAPNVGENDELDDLLGEGTAGAHPEADEGDWTNDFAKDLGLFDDVEVPDTAMRDEEAIREEAEAHRRAEEARKRFEQEERELALTQLKEWYPKFEQHTILRMNQLFGPEPSQTRLAPPKFIKPIQLNRMKLEVQPEQAAEFVVYDSDRTLQLQQRLSQGRIREISPDSVAKIEADIGRKHPQLDGIRGAYGKDGKLTKGSNKEPLSALQMEVSNWEDVLEAGGSSSDDEMTFSSSTSPRELTSAEHSPSSAGHLGSAQTPPPTEGPYIQNIHIYDEDIYNSDEEEALLADKPLKKHTLLDLNDPRLMFVEDRRPLGIKRNRIGGSFAEESQLNISNDRAYDMLRANYQRKVRSTIGSLNIDHSMAALRLQSPFYKVNHTKSQLRAWHRTKFNIKPGTVIHFQSVKSRKRWKDKNRTAQDVFARSGDLTLGDNASFFLIEYSEETPLVLSGFGMGSKLINYYRKKSPDDSSRPKRQIGETHVLEEQDRSTFWNFGFVEPGNVVPTLYNKMIRSPVFQHEPQATDFLLIKSTSRARGVKYFLRSIPYLFVSGQVLPAVQIPGPHSRKVTAASKNRLKMVVYRVLNKDPHHRLQIRDISVHFPDHNEVQNRQRLKEFMEYQRSGDDQGFWKVKPGDNLPNETEIRAMISPEDIMLLESMRVGQQHLEDSGYSKTVDDEDNTNDRDNDGLSLEEQLAPWNISRNFINAIQGKAMLQLNGIGDPTSRGEGFSFLRTSMKGGFATEVSAEDEKKLGGHSYNVALQQKAYDEEIKRIWYAQRRSLSVTNPRALPEANKLPDQIESTAQTPSAGPSNKVLQITRVVRDENDVLVRQTELVTDTQVIRAYLRRKKTQEEEKMAVDQISVTDDVEANKQRRKFLEAELARLNRNADRRQARKATKQDPKLKATTRKCATCGAVGHIKTNKSCPMYNDIYLNAASSNKKQ